MQTRYTAASQVPGIRTQHLQCVCGNIWGIHLGAPLLFLFILFSDDHLQTPPSVGSSVLIFSVKPSAFLSFPFHPNQGPFPRVSKGKPQLENPKLSWVLYSCRELLKLQRPNRPPSRMSASRLKAATEAS